MSVFSAVRSSMGLFLVSLMNIVWRAFNDTVLAIRKSKVTSN
jgi:hypothetical protein